MLITCCIAALLTVSGIAQTSSPLAQAWTALVAPDNAFHCLLLNNDRLAIRMGLVSWGPNWEWRPEPQSTNSRIDGQLHCSAPLLLNERTGGKIQVSLDARCEANQQLICQYQLAADDDQPLTMFAVLLSFPDPSRRGEARATLQNGASKTLPLPMKSSANLELLRSIQFRFEDGGEVAFAFDPPRSIQPENNEMRVILAGNVFHKGSETTKLTIDYTGPISFAAQSQDLQKYISRVADSTWFPFSPHPSTQPSVIGMEDWLDKPAGVHGGVRISGDQFKFEDGTPIKFWGTNISYAGAAPTREEAILTARRFAKYGINAVRLHKFAGPTGWEGIADKQDATQFDSDGLNRLDFFCSQLQSQGIYYGFSHTYKFMVGASNKDRVLAYDEIAKHNGDCYGLINFAEDIQDLLIERIVNLLQHRNSFTGKKYADDPALAFVEMQNEDDIFFFTTGAVLESFPTYRRHFEVQFSDWLNAKYGSQQKLAAAWGSALKEGESLANRNIAIQGNPWFMGEDGLKQQPAGGNKRLMDNAEFFHVTQNRFYEKCERAIRKAGYQGPLIGSAWQAPLIVPHYYNLRSDYLVGYIDRHNYFGGSLSDSMLKRPGSGYLEVGLQQVIDRPFGISEWNHVYPSLYSAEGPPIVAAYGMGLQGWDASYEFQSSSNREFSPIVGQQPWGVWETDVPTQIGQFPTLSRMVLRGDVKQGDVISVTQIGNSDLTNGLSAASNIAVPRQTLAAGRVAVQFTDRPASSPPMNLTRNQGKDTITSSTGELTWDTTDRGYVTINTSSSKAVVGFAGDKHFDFGDLSMDIASPFASIVITARGREETLSNSRTALISAVARNCNTGFKYFVPSGQILSNGNAPILMEPIRATIAFSRRSIAAVNVLDQSGNRTSKTVELSGNSFVIDGTKDRALYYEVVFK
ncbi:MAG TPA: hypothetical protein VHD56_07975 [Tepidisphaeraceae bacterium]|nr:hypothetical protein [Tepidisphaeraceae bacterium]